MKRSYYLLAFTIPVAIYLSFYLKGSFSYFAVFFAFFILPLIELLLPPLNSNFSMAEESLIKDDSFFDAILWMMVPIQFALLVYFCQIISDPIISISERVGLISAMGLGCGVLGINVAHELGHRKNSFEQTLARMLLTTSLYWHFFIEHNKGHHKNVSTFHDPETSRLNESIYGFWFRSIKDSFLSAFKIDPQEMVKAILIQSLFAFGIYFIWGKLALWGFLSSALIGVILLESVNYIEHYGLVRKELESGRFEKVRPVHSWNANHLLSRAVLFELSRHSDHHAYANRKYQLLRHYDESPQMPTGYPGMILLSLIPPLWFKVMNERISKIQSL